MDTLIQFAYVVSAALFIFGLKRAGLAGDRTLGAT